MSRKKTPPTSEMIEDLIARILTSRKYTGLGIPPNTVRDLVDQALKHGAGSADIEKIVKEKLHNLVAPYLGDPDYSSLAADLACLPRDVSSPQLQSWCLEVMRRHSSTRERIPILNEFYPSIFAFTGKPRSILDLACGLNPFAIPWMRLDRDVEYLAFDLHQPRVDLIDSFLKHIGQNGAAIHDDILVQPIGHQAEVAFFFKEAHRFEQRQHGVNRAFFQTVPARHLLVSLPTANLTGSRSMLAQDRALIEQSLAGLDWNVEEISFTNEIVFCIEKNNEA